MADGNLVEPGDVLHEVCQVVEVQVVAGVEAEGAGPGRFGGLDINGSVISCDSMQVYKGMDIGTAKITSEEMQEIPHYLIDVLNPSDDFNIVMFKDMAQKAITKIRSEGRIPIMCGGTGFYIQSVLYDIDFDETGDDPDYRQYLIDLIDEKGGPFVHKMLEEADPDAADHIHHNDSKRMIRALEFYKQTGKRISKHNRESHDRTSPYNFCYFFLDDDRSRVYERIDKRVDDMIDAGLVDEVSGLVASGLTRENVSMHGLGYKEIIEYLEGECTLEEAVYRIKRDSRHFAKRQITWSKREKEIIRIDLSGGQDAIPIMMDDIKKKGIIDERSV